MAQVLIRDLDPEVVEKLRGRVRARPSAGPYP
jgi:hypothetical protein